MQFDHFFPAITQPCSYAKPLIDANMGEPYRMLPIGDFALKDRLFPRCPGDSLVFKEEELNALCGRASQFSPTGMSAIGPQAARRRLTDPPVTKKKLQSEGARLLRHSLGMLTLPAASHPLAGTRSHPVPRNTEISHDQGTKKSNVHQEPQKLTMTQGPQKQM